MEDTITRPRPVVHIASHHISPGKKQWTWGNHEFGYAWDRNLTDSDGPYIELMAGVYTDNQPDFSFLAPGETKTFSQFWYPIQKIGPAKHANVDAAVNCEPGQLGICVTRPFPSATIRLLRKGAVIFGEKWDLKPGEPFIRKNGFHDATELLVTDRDGQEIVRYSLKPAAKGKPVSAATEPPSPPEVPGNDELYAIGLHLEQYRHATRRPEGYWQEALRRDPLDARCNNAIGLWHLRRSEFQSAERHFRNAIRRITSRNPNPYDGEPYYNLGLCLRYRAEESAGRDGATGRSRSSSESARPAVAPYLASAYDAFYKSTWNHAWQSASYHAIAELDCLRQDWTKALDHLDRSLRVGTDNLRARDLKAIVLRKLGRDAAAEILIRDTLALDPLDWWARWLMSRSGTTMAGEAPGLQCDGQTRLDIALDYARAGFFAEAIEVLSDRLSSHLDPLSQQGEGHQADGTAPLVRYYLGWLYQRLGDRREAVTQYRAAGEVFQ